MTSPVDPMLGVDRPSIIRDVPVVHDDDDERLDDRSSDILERDDIEVLDGSGTADTHDDTVGADDLSSDTDESDEADEDVVSDVDEPAEQHGQHGQHGQHDVPTDLGIDVEAMMDPDVLVTPRGLAVSFFNRTWELLDIEPRTAADDREMLASAFASRLLWQDAGGPEQHATGDWLIAHVASQLRHAEIALQFAVAAYQTVLGTQPAAPTWLLASTQEGLARAHAVAGHAIERDRYAADARRTLRKVDDDEDRALIEAQLASIPDLSD